MMTSHNDVMLYLNYYIALKSSELKKQKEKFNFVSYPKQHLAEVLEPNITKIVKEACRKIAAVTEEGC